ncbi:MAG: hypothetical protein GX625_20695 [Clostridiaceae bacterium]|nr:hypothetical protein [Clostridiaceae bacterium]
MGRDKKITSEQLILMIDKYALNHPREKISIPALSNYLIDNGFDVAPYLIRRDKAAREHIDKINSQDNEDIQRNVVTYHQLDIDNFVKTNSSIDKLRTALAQRDAYYASISNSAAIIFAENKELKSSIEYYRKEYEELKDKVQKKIQKDENKSIREKDEVILRLKKLLDEYVYPEVANLLLEKEGLLETVNTIIDKDKLSAITVEPDSDISKITFQSIESIMKGFDE